MPPHVRHRSEPHYSTFEDESETHLPAGARLVDGRIEIVGELARSQVSVVYVAIDHELDGREVAFKVVRARADGVNTEARYTNEARLGASLAGHPHIVRSVGVGRLTGPVGFEGRMYLVTELVSGPSLAEVMMANRTGLPVARACAIGSDVAKALVAIHERGIVHRDIKPGNVVLTQLGDTEVAKTIDFGIAYSTGDGREAKSEDLTTGGGAPGTALYMSPQQVAHEQPTPAFDVYAWGAMFYELVSGMPPYDGMPEAALLLHKCDPRNRPFPLSRMRAGVPHYLADLVDRCLAYEPSQRPTAAEIIETLQRGNPTARVDVPDLRVLSVADATVVTPIRETTDSSTGRSPNRALLLLGVPVLVLLVLLGVGLWRVYGPAKPTADVPRDDEAAIAPHSQPSPAAPEPVAPAPSVAPPQPVPSQAEPPQAEPSPPAADDGPKPHPPPVPDRPTTPAPDKPSPEPRVRVPAAQTAECTKRRDAAAAAKAAGQWRDVLKQTNKAKCWTDRNDRTLLRVVALHGLRRFSECAELAKGSHDPFVARRGRLCESALSSAPK